MIEPEKRKHVNPIDMSRKWRIIYAVSIFVMIAPLLWGFGEHFLKTLEISMIALLLLNPVIIFVVEVSIIRQVGKSIRYEVQDGTQIPYNSEGFDSWGWLIQIASGIIVHNRRNILFLYILRLVTFFWGMVYFYRRAYEFIGWYTADATLLDIKFDLNALLSATVILLIFLVLEMLLIVAISLYMNLSRRTHTYATWFTVGLRIGVPLLIAFFIPMSIFALQRLRGEPPIYNYYDSLDFHVGLEGLIVVLHDNGILWSVAILDRFSSSTYVDYSLFYLAEILGIGLYILWTWIMLRLAKSTLDRQLRKGKRKQKAKPV